MVGDAIVASFSSRWEGCFVRAAAQLTVVGSRRGDGIVTDQQQTQWIEWVRQAAVACKRKVRHGYPVEGWCMDDESGCDICNSLSALSARAISTFAANGYFVFCEQHARKLGLLW